MGETRRNRRNKNHEFSSVGGLVEQANIEMSLFAILPPSLGMCRNAAAMNQEASLKRIFSLFVFFLLLTRKPHGIFWGLELEVVCSGVEMRGAASCDLTAASWRFEAVLRHALRGQLWQNVVQVVGVGVAVARQVGHHLRFVVDAVPHHRVGLAGGAGRAHGEDEAPHPRHLQQLQDLPTRVKEIGSLRVCFGTNLVILFLSQYRRGDTLWSYEYHHVYCYFLN